MASASLKHALAFITGQHEALNHHLKSVECPKLPDLPRVTANFHYVAFRDGKSTTKDFIDYLKHQLIYFCIPRRERERVNQQILAAPNDKYRLIIELFDKAKGLFIKARAQREKSGEPGELILFMLLEWALGAPQIVSKMYLKTNSNMPVHGTDGIHAGYSDDKKLLLYWGESKLYKTFAGALDSALNSVSGFLKERGPEDREIDLIRDHHSFGPEDTKLADALLEYLDPYSPKSKERTTVFACFIGWNFSGFNGLSGLTSEQAEQSFTAACTKRINTAIEQIKTKIIESDLQQTNFHFFMIPFESVEELRQAFFDVLGIK